MKRKRSADQFLFRPSEEVKSLPVRQKTNRILSELAGNDVLIVIGETGSGKTTQIPQIIVESDSSASVVVTQPRRVAAITVATRVAEERNVELGMQVGYAVRFADKSRRGLTNIRYVTDGVLLREALAEGSIGLKKRYSHVIIDEVHERAMNTDILLGVIKETLLAESAKNAKPQTGFAAKNEMFARMIRSKLAFKVVIMSATTNADKIAEFFRNKSSLRVSVLKIAGRTHDVQVMYSCSPVPDYIDGSVDTVIQIHSGQPMNGDILVFLPGQEEILSAIAITKERLKRHKSGKSSKEPNRELRVCSLFASLSSDDQLQAIEPLPEELRPGVRKVIFATNIAETSITIPNIVYVVDSGVVKVRKMMQDEGLFADVLAVQPVSKAQADQRKGRAGRTAPGFLFRLYVEKEYNGMEDYPQPEVLRTDASASVLQIVSLCKAFAKSRSATQTEKIKKLKPGAEVTRFPLLDRIPQPFMISAVENLILLGAVDKSLKLTNAGVLMSRLPVPPMLARCLLESLRVGCVESMIGVAAVLSVEGAILMSPTAKRDKAKAAHRRFLSIYGDHLTLLNVLNAFLPLDGAARRKEFCRDHFLNYRTLVSAESIRVQLSHILDLGAMVSWGLSNPLSASLAADIEHAGIEELVRRCLVAGFFRQTAKKSRESGTYIPMGLGSAASDSDELAVRRLDIHPSSSLRALRSRRNPPFVIYDEYVVTTKRYLRTVVSFESAWLSQHCSYFR
ncbi:Similarity to pre-mRNA-splicing factor ATP-dependent RNA helicase PRP43 [Chondrus crispus]|uniref:RNA helicase n=1 Tax=Chondrus crispus TaxID=2769 RepID=R7QJF5_CHOCR|nr:Similarity to pre-mRNA-splicing factor ATP-dependent RNA helicase PRP43 [Chondrus crispus]CDF37591.1 Similarity to pre-mRNA-splicing factor ATP-dependent RNA helicase PRP43 [Chondrus crispus]|eukprot:XP_005717462.1 Similarity to pre-mRNA-splicing factor ATP-dependent RNA helicase PRP43 [Chondrus crispus]